MAAKAQPLLPAFVKKHVAVVHCNAPLTFLQRRVANILLVKAYAELPDPSVVMHEIPVRELAAAAGYNSNDHEHLKQSFRALRAVEVEWNVFNQEGEPEWGVTGYLSEARIVGGRCRFAFPPFMRERLYNPRVYALISLAVQQRLSTASALALYENCARFVNTSSTGWHPVDTWKEVLGIGRHLHKQYKYFKRDILNPAVADVNAMSDIVVTMGERKAGKRVAFLKFEIERKGQMRLPFDLPAMEAVGAASPAHARALLEAEEAPLLRALSRAGLSTTEIEYALAEYGADRVEANLNYYHNEVARGRAIRKPSRFLLAAIRDDYAAEAAPERTAPRPGRGAQGKGAPPPPQPDPHRAVREQLWADAAPRARTALLAQARERLREEEPALSALLEPLEVEGPVTYDRLPYYLRFLMKSWCMDELEGQPR